MSAVGGQGPGGIDLAAVARDDQLLDLLASRSGTDLGDDPVAALLAAFVAEVDDGLPELLDGLGAEPPVPVGPQPGVRRGRALRVTSVALVMGATLSVSGVAAAVTGDPLAPYKGLVSAISGQDQLPEQAARVAALNRELRGTRAQIAHGDLAGAHARLDALTSRLASMTDLSDGERAALQARIASLEAALARAEAKAEPSQRADPGRSATGGSSEGSRPTDAGKPDDPGGPGDDAGAGGAQQGNHDTGGGEKAQGPKASRDTSGRRGNDQGSGESVAPDDQSAGTDDQGDSTADQDGASTGDANGQGGSTSGGRGGQDRD